MNKVILLKDHSILGDRMPFCPKCGKEVPSEAIFCPSCGANLRITVRGREHTKKRNLIIVSIVILIALTVPIGLYYTRPDIDLKTGFLSLDFTNYGGAASNVQITISWTETDFLTGKQTPHTLHYSFNQLRERETRSIQISLKSNMKITLEADWLGSILFGRYVKIWTSTY